MTGVATIRASFGGARLIPIEGQGERWRRSPALKMRRFQRGQWNAMGVSGSTPAPVQSVPQRSDRSDIAAMMERVHRGLGRKPPVELGEIADKQPRSARRYFDGTRLPSSTAWFRMMRSPLTAALLVVESTRDLPPDRRRKVLKAVARAALIAEDAL